MGWWVVSMTMEYSILMQKLNWLAWLNVNVISFLLLLLYSVTVEFRAHMLKVTLEDQYTHAKMMKCQSTCMLDPITDESCYTNEVPVHVLKTSSQC